MAKTLAIKTLSTAVDAKFSRIQFTIRFVACRYFGYHDLQSCQKRICSQKRTHFRQFRFGR
ncbi:MAG: hypothetical protein R2784_06730 [Saprospiraceae bacterium]